MSFKGAISNINSFLLPEEANVASEEPSWAGMRSWLAQATSTATLTENLPKCGEKPPHSEGASKWYQQVTAATQKGQIRQECPAGQQTQHGFLPSKELIWVRPTPPHCYLVTCRNKMLHAMRVNLIFLPDVKCHSEDHEWRDPRPYCSGDLTSNVNISGSFSSYSFSSCSSPTLHPKTPQGWPPQNYLRWLENRIQVQVSPDIMIPKGNLSTTLTVGRSGSSWLNR